MTETKPRDLDFNSSSMPILAGPTGWGGLRLPLSSGITGPALPLESPSSVNAQRAAILHDADTVAGETSKLAACAPNWAAPTDARVSAWGRNLNLAFGTTSADPRGWGVFARAGLGATSEVESIGLTASASSGCYAARIFPVALNKLRVVFESNGVVLATSPDMEVLPGTGTGIFTNHGLRMEVEDTGPGVSRVRVYTQGINYAIDLRGAGPEIVVESDGFTASPTFINGKVVPASGWSLLLQFDVAGANYRAGTGGVAGLIGSRLEESGSKAWGTLNEWFEVVDITDSENRYREEWRRAKPALRSVSSTSPGDPLDLIGDPLNLASFATYDIAGAQSPASSAVLTNIGAALTVRTPGASGRSLYQRLADDPKSQHRSADFVLRPQTTAGLWQRATVQNVPLSVAEQHPHWVNISQFTDFNTFGAAYRFNLFKGARTWSAASNGPGGFTAFGVPVNAQDSNGYPILVGAEAAETLMMVDVFSPGHSPSPLPVYKAGRYVLTYEGTGEFIIRRDGVATSVTTGSTGATNVAVPVSPGRIEFDVFPTAAGISVKIETSSVGNNIRNIRVYRLADEADLNAGGPRWDPDFLEELAVFSGIRVMEGIDCNLISIDQLSEKIDLDYYSWTTERGHAVEAWTSLANELGCGLWWTIYAGGSGDEDFVRDDVRRLKNGLNPTLPLILEVGNENWQVGYFTLGGADNNEPLNTIPGQVGETYYAGGLFPPAHFWRVGNDPQPSSANPGGVYPGPNRLDNDTNTARMKAYADAHFQAMLWARDEWGQGYSDRVIQASNFQAANSFWSRVFFDRIIAQNGVNGLNLTVDLQTIALYFPTGFNNDQLGVSNVSGSFTNGETVTLQPSGVQIKFEQFFGADRMRYSIIGPLFQSPPTTGGVPNDTQVVGASGTADLDSIHPSGNGNVRVLQPLADNYVYLNLETDKAIAFIDAHVAVAQEYGIPLGQYEWGQQITPSDFPNFGNASDPANLTAFQNFLTIEFSTQMAAETLRLGQAWRSKVGDTIQAYYNIYEKAWVIGGQFGLKLYPGQASPKFDAMLQLIAESSGTAPPSPSSTTDRGYTLTVEMDAAGDADAVLRRLSQGVATELARVAVPSVSDFVAFELDLDIYNGNGTSGDGPVFLECSINGSPIAWSTVSAQGAALGVPGMVIDASDLRVTSGAREGWVLTQSGSAPPTMDNWTQGVLNSDVPINPNTVPTTPVFTEAQQAVGVLDLAPVWEINVGRRRTGRKARMRSGRLRTVAGANPTVRFARFNTILEKSALTALRAFADSKGNTADGTEVPFIFRISQHIAIESDGLWIFGDGSIQARPLPGDTSHYFVSFVLEEVTFA